jgi:acyl carrier protein
MSDKKPTRGEIERRVKQVIANAANIDEKKMKSNLHLQNDLGIDSFTSIEMIYSAEDEFGISISDAELANVTTINDIVDIIQQKI